MELLNFCDKNRLSACIVFAGLTHEELTKTLASKTYNPEVPCNLPF